MAAADPNSQQDEDDTDRLVGALLELEGGRDAFFRLVAAEPDVLAPDVEQRLADMGETPTFGLVFTDFATLVREARSDPAGAWEAFDRAMTEATALGEEVERIESQVAEELDVGRPARALELIDDAIDKASRAGLGLAVADLHLRAGQVLIRGGVEERDEEVERAIRHFEAGLEFAGPPEQAANLFMHLGFAGPERVRGDRRENADQGAQFLRRALEIMDASEPDEFDAIIRTNLASVLLGRETDDPVQNLNEARSLVERALEYRSPERDADDWAYSQINLALIIDRLAGHGEADPDEAVAAWQKVIDRGDQCAPHLVGHAHHGIGEQLLGRAEPSSADLTEEEIEEEDSLELDLGLLRDARDHLRQARPLLLDGPDQLARGRALNQLAHALDSLEETEGSIAVGREALELLGPTTAPRDCIRVAYRLGGQLATLDEFEDAAAVFRAGVLAAEITIDTRLDSRDRSRETKRAGNIARWASYCMARVGEPLEAALTLENGRTRELRRRLGRGAVDDGADPLEGLPQELRERYEAALANIVVTRLDGAGSDASRALQEVLYDIRREPGFESFDAGTDAHGLRRAVQPGWPLLYVNPTPWGTLLILVGDDGGELQIATEFLAPTSTEVFFRLLVGNAAETFDLDEDSDARSYLFGISTPEERDLREDIEQALPWLGDQLCQPIAGFLESYGVVAATVIVCGPLAAAPLHAAPWKVDGGERCLLDHVDVRFAPSAALAGAAIVRAHAADQVEPRLLGLAYSGEHRELVAAVPEVREVAEHFDQDRRLIFEDDEATSVNLIRHARDATHIHLACHADAGLFEAEESTVVLADREVAALELTQLVGLRTRLVCVSACRSAMAEIANLADEVMSFGTAVLAAGSACVIATLWPVDDAAAALCMVRLYEELQHPDVTPPQALRRAQLWLRDLTDDDLDRYLASHPALEAEFRRRRTDGDPPGRRGLGSGGQSGVFSHPDYWACFIASGA